MLLLPAEFLGKTVQFLVDSCAERSVIPKQLIPDALLYPTNVILNAAGGNKIETFGQCSHKIGVKGLRRDFLVNLIVTNTQPIFGANFLTNNTLQLDMKRRVLTDPETNISAQLIAQEGPSLQLKAVEVVYYNIFTKFP